MTISFFCIKHFDQFTASNSNLFAFTFTCIHLADVLNKHKPLNNLHGACHDLDHPNASGIIIPAWHTSTAFLTELVMLLEWWSCTECMLYTDQATVDKFGKEHVIIILNHNYEIDFLCGWTMCERYGILGVSPDKQWRHRSEVVKDGVFSFVVWQLCAKTL